MISSATVASDLIKKRIKEVGYVEQSWMFKKLALFWIGLEYPGILHATKRLWTKLNKKATK